VKRAIFFDENDMPRAFYPMKIYTRGTFENAKTGEIYVGGFFIELKKSECFLSESEIMPLISDPMVMRTIVAEISKHIKIENISPMIIEQIDSDYKDINEEKEK
jgi:hypothetical protein